MEGRKLLRRFTYEKLTRQNRAQAASRGSVAGAHACLKNMKTRFDSEPRHKIAGVV
jgi:hypothetical protein